MILSQRKWQVDNPEWVYHISYETKYGGHCGLNLVYSKIHLIHSLFEEHVD